MGRVLFATSNEGKLRELRAVLEPCGYRVEPAPVAKLEIQSEDIARIAVVAASTAYSILGEPVAVEDAGLFIDALGGFPGPYSSYVYKTIGIRGILKLMEGVADRRARFRAVIAYAGPWGVEVFEGVVEGRIAEEPRGSGGFGFDPIFIPDGYKKTFAEMGVEEKSRISHRARAASRLCEWLRGRR